MSFARPSEARDGNKGKVVQVGRQKYNKTIKLDSGSTKYLIVLVISYVLTDKGKITHLLHLQNVESIQFNLKMFHFNYS